MSQNLAFQLVAVLDAVVLYDTMRAMGVNPRMPSRFCRVQLSAGSTSSSHTVHTNTTTSHPTNPQTQQRSHTESFGRAIMGKDKNAGGKGGGKKGSKGGDDNKDSGGAGGKVKGAQSINVRHILVRIPTLR